MFFDTATYEFDTSFMIASQQNKPKKAYMYYTRRLQDLAQVWLSTPIAWNLTENLISFVSIVVRLITILLNGVKHNYLLIQKLIALQVYLEIVLRMSTGEALLNCDYIGRQDA